ncbi:Rieske 2Fe-2S domain-containing protein [Pseudogulbenkiania sp. MAI-1]|uniref:Rieske (2Fe-2S) protein n=1 Tax=Pseudogulbenkiania sp. MAI-1 TaxID=990370 RepID=UPI00045E95E4|nr:Rieske 2Fe-2S domain-containing protein [Pseudogulbenkiania sp. MAI-1]
MAETADRLICASAELVNSGKAVRFGITDANGQSLSALVFRYQGRVFAYHNSCRHIPVELDLTDGEVFDLTGHYLVCSMHGALYLPENGLCVGGPCRGQRLTPVAVTERDGQVYCITATACGDMERNGER